MASSLARSITASGPSKKTSAGVRATSGMAANRPGASTTSSNLAARKASDARRDDDLSLADMDFTTLIDSGKKDFVGEGLVGRARVIYRKDPELHADEALSLCNRAVEMEGNALAMMLMAAIYMDKKNDAETARKWSMRAFKSGSIWGVRYMSVISYRNKNYISSLGWNLLSIICSPFAKKKYKFRGPFK